MVVDAGARRLSCPQCKNVVTVAAGQRPSCDACGYGAQAAPRAQPVHAAAAAIGQPARGTATPSGYGGSGYGTPVQQQTYAPQAQPSTGMGVTSMVLGILGMFFGLPVAFFVPFIGMFNLLAILAIIFGAVQIKNVKRDPANYGGGGMAKAGLIMGIIVLAISVAVSLAFVGLFGALMAST